jgi:hypothetical protein
MNLTSLIRTLILLFTALVLASCASIKTVGEFHMKEFQGQFNNFLIIGATTNADQRGRFENKFVEALTNENVAALQSYKLIYDTRGLTREVVAAAIKGKDIDAVLITRLIALKQEEVYRRTEDRDEGLNYFTFYDNALSQSEDGYSAEFDVLTLETRVYDVLSGLMVWTMQSQNVDPSAARDLIENQIELTIETLRNRNLIGPGS